MSADVHVVILAAGQGTRMKSQLPKVLHRLAGRSMIEHVLAVAATLSPRTVTVVVGHRADLVRRELAACLGVQFALQEPQLGTAHALQQAEPFLQGQSGTLLLLSGDVPLLTASTLRRLVEGHHAAAAAATGTAATGASATATAAIGAAGNGAAGTESAAIGGAGAATAATGSATGGADGCDPFDATAGAIPRSKSSHTSSTSLRPTGFWPAANPPSSALSQMTLMTRGVPCERW